MSEIIAIAIAAVHAAVALFVVFGLFAIAVGSVAKWKATENIRFRVSHLAIVVLIWLRLQLGCPCPFSVAEDAVRGKMHLTALSHLAFRGSDEALFNIGCSAVFTATCLFAANFFIRLRFPPIPRPPR